MGMAVVPGLLSSCVDASEQPATPKRERDKFQITIMTLNRGPDLAPRMCRVSKGLERSLQPQRERERDNFQINIMTLNRDSDLATPICRVSEGA
jgi:hypothetical protein